MSLSLRRTVAFVACLYLASGCTAEPEIVEVSPGTETAPTVPEITTTEPPLDEPTLDEPNATTEEPPATTPSEPVLEDATAIDIAADFVDQLRVGADSGDYAAAGAMWSGYPFGEAERASNLANLTAAHPWLLSGELSFEAFDSWAFEPQWAMTIVVITDAEPASVATLLLDRTGVIQRIDDVVTEASRPIVIEGDVVVIDGVPTEGSALAYLDGELLAEPVVDYEVFTTTFVLPPPIGRPQVLVTSFATPEFPFTRAFILDRS